MLNRCTHSCASSLACTCPQPKALNATRMGVGACVWEGELLLAAYLAGLPRHRYIGATVIELGSGRPLCR